MVLAEQFHNWTSDALVVLIAAAGLYYLFISRAAHRLATVENRDVNERRIRLRRINAVMMILLAALLFLATRVLGTHPRSLALVMLGILLLLVVIVWLAMVDLRMLMQLRDRRRDHDAWQHRN